MKDIVKKIFFIGIIIVFLYYLFSDSDVSKIDLSSRNEKVFSILSSYDNSIVEDEIVKFGKKNDMDVVVTYMGDLDIVDELNHNSKNYDAVWISNSMWLYMLDNSYLTSNSKSISISPVVFGIRKSKVKDLGLDINNITNTDILNLIRDKKIKYVMPSVTRTNTGAAAYLGFLASLAGNPEVLTDDMIHNPDLINNLKDVFSGVERVSGDEKYLEDMFLNDDKFEAIISSESSLININKELMSKKKDELYLIYPKDGVAINDSTFAFIKNSDIKEDFFLELQKYLLSSDGQKLLLDNGQRTWYGGVNKNVDKNVFNPNWGIDTTKYLSVTKFPSKDIITSAINVYIESIRKPTHVVFCLDYSGSMYGDGARDLTSAMSYILDYNKASVDKLQFSDNDKISVITFGSKVYDVWETNSGRDTSRIINNINNKEPDGTTALYAAINKGLDILNKESDEYTKTVIAMTDGYANVGSFSDLSSKYKKSNSNVPIYSITFGSASESQLMDIAKLSNAKVFDGKSDLLRAFKEVRGYN